MVYIRAARDAYPTGEIRDVGWIRSPQKIAEGFKKIAKSRALSSYLDCGKLDTVVEKWVVRNYSRPKGG